MSVEQLLFEHYDGVIDSPEAVLKLRKFILDLAVRGRLVEQDPDDEPASELLVRIAATREKLSKSGSIKKINNLTNVESSPYNVPTNWQWTRIREVTSDRGQIVPETEFTYIDVSAIDKEEGVVAEPKVMRAENAPSRARKLAKKNDVIYSCVRPYLLNVAIIDRDFDPKPIVSTAFAVLNGYNLVSPRYLWIVLRSPFMIECVESNQRGQAYPAINDSDFAKLPFPLPPLAEQQRIVAKVDELIDQCDRLEDEFKEREHHRKRFTKASFSSLTESGLDRCEFRQRSGFVVENFDRLSVDVNQITSLRKLILDLAVRGRLMEQGPDDESAEVFLNQVAEERKNASVFDKNSVVNLDDLDQKFELPYGWEWSAIEDIAHVTMGQSPKSEDCNNTGDGIAFFQGKADFGNRHPTPKNWCVKPKKIAERGDVLISVRAPVGPTNVANQRCCIGRGLAALRPLSYISREFLLLTLKALESDLLSKGYGTTFAAITKKQLTGYSIPLPPLVEQHRIVGKVDLMMLQCDRLEERVRLKETLQGRSFCSILARFLNDELIPGHSTNKRIPEQESH